MYINMHKLAKRVVHDNPRRRRWNPPTSGVAAMPGAGAAGKDAWTAMP
jgi:hypothetical protein